MSEPLPKRPKTFGLFDRVPEDAPDDSKKLLRPSSTLDDSRTVPRPQPGSYGPPKPPKKTEGVVKVEQNPRVFPQLQQEQESDQDKHMILQRERESEMVRARRRAGIPASEAIYMSKHSKSVTAIALDTAGARVCTGALEGHLFLWDFAGMQADNSTILDGSDTASIQQSMALQKRSLKPFREVEVAAGNPVNSITWSAKGDMFVVTTGTVHARVFDREGTFLGETVQGDRYIFDLTQTNGHTSSISAAVWHPVHENAIFSAGLDGSVRLWSTETLQKKNLAVFKCRTEQNRNIPVTALAVTPPNAPRHMFVAGCEDGSIHIWAISASERLGTINTAHRSQPAPTVGVIEAHGGPVTSLAFCVRDGETLLLVRSGGDTGALRLFNLKNARAKLLEYKRAEAKERRLGARSVNSPSVQSLPCLIHEWLNMPNRGDRATCGFSPDGSLAFTGVEGLVPSSDSAGGKAAGELVMVNSGSLLFFYTNSLASNAVAAFLPVCELVAVAQNGIADRRIGGVTVCLWHPRLNQILVGTAHGGVHVFYDSEESTHGAKLCVRARQPKLLPEKVESDRSIEGTRPRALSVAGNRQKQQKAVDRSLAQILQERADAAGAMRGVDLERFKTTMKHKDQERRTVGVSQAAVESNAPVVARTGARGFGGALGGGTQAQALLARSLQIDEDISGVDVREAILRHERVDPDSVFAAAYKDTQPTTILDYEGAERDAEEARLAEARARAKERQLRQASKR